MRRSKIKDVSALATLRYLQAIGYRGNLVVTVPAGKVDMRLLDKLRERAQREGRTLELRCA
jgi:hypothetical protein